jgi:tyrosyl-tRNA synthetase
VSEDVPVVKVSLAEEGLLSVAESGAPEIRVPKLLVLAGLASSAGDATRKLAENAVSVDGQKFNGKLLKGVKAGNSHTLRLGKKSVRVEWV